jgi:hypothetical protein
MSKVTVDAPESTFNLGGTTAANTNGVKAAQDDGGATFDLTAVEEPSFDLLPKGNYSAVVESLEFGDSSKGNPMISVVYTVIDPEFENRKLYDWWVIKGDGDKFGLAKLKKFLVRVMPDENITAFNPKAFADGGAAVGRELVVEVGIQTQKTGDYKGQKRNTVRDILAPKSNGSFLA